MKRITTLLTVLIILLSFSLLQAGEQERTPEFWNVYSKNLVKCIKEGNEGVRNAALQRVITYGDNLNVNDAVFEIMHIYRTDKDQHARQLALSALHTMKNEWAIGFLKLQAPHEKNPTLQKQIYAMIKDFEQSKI